MTDISKHPILRAIYDTMQAIEVCGASPELTRAVTLAGDVLRQADELVALLPAAKDMHESMEIPMGDTVQNAVHQVYFRAGLLACRESMARFVEAESPTIAASIRANWWPALSADPGAPRRLEFSEVADGSEEGPWTVKQVCPSVEALPIAAGFLQATGATGGGNG